MDRIITRPKEIVKNKQFLYAGNHFISIPVIDCQNGSIQNMNVVSLSNKSLVELKGEQDLLRPHFFKDGKEIEVEKTDISKEQNYLPRLEFFLKSGIKVTGKIFTDLEEKGLIYSFESSEKIEISLFFDLKTVSLLRFNSHRIDYKKRIKKDEWLGNPVVDIFSSKVSLALAFGGDKSFKVDDFKGKQSLNLKISCENRNCFYIALNYDSDGASATLIHLKRKGYDRIYREFIEWLKQKTISCPGDPILETRLNENLFFSYFYSIAKDMESDRYLALTSRSPRYYVSGAFWERDCFLWSFPAVRLVCPQLYQHLAREMILMHSKNPGDHAHYIDGTVLYPGFELDEAAAYFILSGNLEDCLLDERLVKALEKIFQRIEREYDPQTGLYKTFLLPSDDPAEYPLVTIDNVILWRGLQNWKEILSGKGEIKRAQFVKQRIDGIHKGIYKYLIREIDGKNMFLWSADGKGNFRLYNDPPGSLGNLCFYGFVNKEDLIFKDTMDYYYSSSYSYYFEDAKINEPACDHHPRTPSGLGLCGSILNPLLRNRALNWLKKANMDYGLLAESFDKDSGEARTGVGFASGCGYLAYSLYHALIKEERE
ncbi:MAG: glycoside hydrolase family 125 protein [Candidatus Caldatribacteriota bacterium]|nr:glycoside hydrolase family 125 protein [Candidatus Caldatribacteriota bacterium]